MADSQTYIQANRQTDRQKGRWQAARHTYRQIDRQKGRKVGRWVRRQTREIEKQTD